MQFSFFYSVFVAWHLRCRTSVLLTDVKANGSTDATAAHGVFKGNDYTVDGQPLKDLLNIGGTAKLVGPPESTITISSTGMFSTAADTGVGTPLGDLNWIEIGKSDDPNNGPFTSNPEVTSGTLTLDTAISGNVVLSLKGSNEYAVYAFSNLVNVTYFCFFHASHWP